MMHIKAKATFINNTDYNCHITSIELVHQSHSIYIMPLVINSLRGGHTCKYTHIHTHSDVRTETTLRNQECASHGPACAWFKSLYKII